ncbi:hypothetical protein CYLTODRAFT_421903 [Cylindrobasidium torrendii FP15055 ss-10]|uniref:S-adenosyl-L-methionine-dependent methyltransferase n=1 Tax=Cylindrobasidium torrendii FP15055 ss-10 TaxID=1314674 RepID=A0A0D7BC71_9AGAR|nr:hypothetical protein CYLTODRAFT_421903 [Cylindrobasidium torrendii FP15055 ss-10]
MLETEDILNDALTFFGGEQVKETIINYGPLILTMAPKEGKANTLLADHLFSPSIFLAERIERGLLPYAGKKVIELGAGCALPSLLMSVLPNPPALVTITDYPDPGILGNLKNNISRNSFSFSPGVQVECIGYDWGTDPTPLLSLVDRTGYDIVVLSDLLHFDTSHHVLVDSIQKLLARSPDAVAYIAAGKYTLPPVCEQFVQIAKGAGFQISEVEASHADEGWLGNIEVPSFTIDELAIRKSNCRFWILRWEKLQ